MKKILLRLVLIALAAMTVLSGMTVFADEAAAEQSASSETSSAVSTLVDDISKLPLAKNVTIEDKDAILKVKRAYDALERSDKAQLGADNLAKINEVYAAFEPLLLADVATRAEALPKRAKEKDKDTVTELYNDYKLLSDEALESLDPDLVKKLEKAVEKVAPELVEDGKDKETEETKTEKKSKPVWKTMGMTGWEFAILVFLAVIILFNVAMIAVASVKIFTSKKS